MKRNISIWATMLIFGALTLGFVEGDEHKHEDPRDNENAEASKRAREAVSATTRDTECVGCCNPLLSVQRGDNVRIGTRGGQVFTGQFIKKEVDGKHSYIVVELEGEGDLRMLILEHSIDNLCLIGD